MNKDKRQHKEVRITTDRRRSRRTVLKSIVVGGGAVITSIPREWKSPVVKSVLLPAHAQTSPEVETPGCCITAGRYCGQVESGPLLAIDLSEDGSISVSIGTRGSGTGSVNCMGGEFTIEISGGLSPTVTGTVMCDFTTISGEADGMEYSAVLDGPDCPET